MVDDWDLEELFYHLYPEYKHYNSHGERERGYEIGVEIDNGTVIVTNNANWSCKAYYTFNQLIMEYILKDIRSKTEEK